MKARIVLLLAALLLAFASKAEAQTTPLSTFINSSTDIGSLTGTAKFALSIGAGAARYTTADEINTYWASKLGGACTATTLTGSITITCPGAGSVTSIATSGGISGGTITTTGTLTLTNVAATSHQWADSVVGGSLHFSQPACTDISTAGTVCTQNTGTSGANVPLLSTANQWGNTQTFLTIGGYLAPVTVDASTLRTLSSTDCGTFIKFTSASAVTVTLPNSLAIGCQVAIEQSGAGAVTPTAASGATLRNAHTFTKTFGPGAVIGVTIDANSGGSAAAYVMTGDGA